ncbi:hypothetical protein ACHAPI_001666 [Fusarium lateritium]
MAPPRSKKSRKAPVSDGMRQGSILSFLRPQPAPTPEPEPEPEPATPLLRPASDPPSMPKRSREESRDLSVLERPSKHQRIDDEDFDDEDFDPIVNDDGDDDDDFDPADNVDPAELDDFDELEQVLEENPGASIQDMIDEELPDPVVEASGLIRVGPQPWEPQKWIVSAPPKVARRIIGHRMTVRHEVTDRHIPGCDRQALTQERKDILKCNGYLSRVCDYTGLETSWTFGPHVFSIEAVYPFAVVNNRIAYHGNPNVHFVDNSINGAKRKYPAIFLPVVADWTHAIAEPDFEARKSRLSWGFNAFTNICILNKVFHLTKNHAQQAKQWKPWSLGKKRAVLEVLRTGCKTAVVDQELAKYETKDLFNTKGEVTSTQRSRYMDQGRSTYPAMLRIAQRYGLTKEDFEYHFTLPGRNERERVFYPYHVLSRPQALASGWNWARMVDVCEQMVQTMRTSCNRHAEAAGFGEKKANAIVCLYWMVHFFCDMVQKLKSQRPVATMEEIRFHILDRWNLPMVPWKTHPLKASLCKGPDHGIAMKFGMAEAAIFDPENGIDLSKSTMVLDTWCTNATMRNYAVGDWPSIIATVAAIPLHHSFWRVDLGLGDKAWRGR